MLWLDANETVYEVVMQLTIMARRYNYVSVTRRSIRAGSRYFSQKAVTERGEYGVVFAVRVQVL